MWHDMEHFHEGKTPEGNDRFTIPVPIDDDGMVGRECHQEDCQPRYFKIASRKSEDKKTENPATEQTSIEYLLCPYCGYKDGFQQFITDAQLEWIKSMIFRDMAKSIQDILGDALKPSAPSVDGFITFSLQYKPGSLPSVRHYAEKELKRIINCDKCNGRYAVYGISMYCPLCGQGNLALHLNRSTDIIISLIDHYDNILNKAGQEAGYHLLGNSLEDCVSLFEGFLKIIYSDQLREKVSEDVYKDKLSKLRNVFQQPSKAGQIFKDDLHLDILSGVDDNDKTFLNYQFAKRHIITHNLGLVDEKFKDQVDTWQVTGQEVHLDINEIKKLLTIIKRIIEGAIVKSQLKG